MRTKQTLRKTMRGRPTRGVKKDPQEKIRQVSFMDKIPVIIKDKKTFKRRDTIMIKSHELFYPPTLTHKAWYGPFEITRIYKSNHVEIKEHTRWLSKVPIDKVMHLRDYMQDLSNRREESATQSSENNT
jgi:hypothetical protein